MITPQAVAAVLRVPCTQCGASAGTPCSEYDLGSGACWDRLVAALNAVTAQQSLTPLRESNDHALPGQSEAAHYADAVFSTLLQPGAEDALRRAFSATPEEIGQAAVEAARHPRLEVVVSEPPQDVRDYLLRRWAELPSEPGYKEYDGEQYVDAKQAVWLDAYNALLKETDEVLAASRVAEQNPGVEDQSAYFRRTFTRGLSEAEKEEWLRHINHEDDEE